MGQTLNKNEPKYALPWHNVCLRKQSNINLPKSSYLTKRKSTTENVKNTVHRFEEPYQSGEEKSFEIRSYLFLD